MIPSRFTFHVSRLTPHVRELFLLTLLPALISFLMLWPALLDQRVFAPTDIVSADPLIGGRPLDSPRPAIENPMLGDPVDVFIPWRLYARSELAAGRFPLWNPYNLLGTHFHANLQSQIFSPYNLLWLLLPPMWGLGAVAAIKWTLCGLGMGLLLRRLGLGMAPAVYGAVALQLSGPIVGWLQWPIMEGLAWVPWMFWAALGWLDTLKPGWLAALSLLVAFELLAGHIETTFHSLAFLSVFALAAWGAAEYRAETKGEEPALSLPKGRKTKDGARYSLLGLGGLLAAGALGLGLSAVQLLPFLDILPLSTQWVQRAGGVGNFAPETRAALLWLSPNGFGWADAYAGPFNWIEINPYVGSMTLLLGVWGLGYSLVARVAHWRRKGAIYRAPTEDMPVGARFIAPSLPSLLSTLLSAFSPRKSLFWALMLAVSLSMAYGIPPFSVLRELPGFSSSLNWRLVSVAGPCLIVLGAMGLQRLLSMRNYLPTRFWWLPVVALASVGGAFGLAGAGVWTVDSLQVEAYTQAWRAWSGALFCVGGVLILARLMGWLGARTLGALAVALLLLDLLRAMWGFNPTSPPETFYPINPLTKFLAERGPTERMALVGPYADTNMLLSYRVADYRNYDPTLAHRYMNYSRLLTPETFRKRDIGYSSHLIMVTPSATHMVASAIKWVVCPPGEDPNTWQPPQERGPIYKYTMENAGFTLWENTYVKPYTYFASRFQVAPNDETVLRRMRALTLDRANQAHIEDSLGILPTDISTVETGVPVTEEERDSVKLERHVPGAMELSMEAENKRFLVVSEGWSPGWRAELDGAPAQIYRTNYVLQGVVVPPGKHRVTLTYDPPAFRWGVGISLAALLVWLLLIGFSLWRRRQRS